MTAPPDPHAESNAVTAPPDPRAELAAVIAMIAAALPDSQQPLLAMERFSPDRDALARLADPAWAALGAQACTPAEAQRLAELARTRFASLPGVPPLTRVNPTIPDIW